MVKDKLELGQQSDDVIVIHTVGDHYFNILGHQRMTAKSIELVLHYSNIQNEITTLQVATILVAMASKILNLAP